jgi:tetratricopeptide (TPR) repeat protein
MSNQFAKFGWKCFGAFALLFFLAAANGSAMAQVAMLASKPQAIDAPVDALITETLAKPLSTDDQKKVVREIYDATKTAKSAPQLTSLIVKCDAAIENRLSQKRDKYVRSLKSWALNRRGAKRCELARQFKSIGNIASYKQAFDETMSDFNDAIATDTTRHRTWNSRGIAYVLDGQYVAAIKDFTEAAKLKADYSVAFFNRAEALYEIKRYDAAVDDYQAYLRLNPNDAQAITGRAHAQLALGKTEQAIADYQLLADAYPQNSTAFVNLGDAQAAAGDWSLAIQNCAAAVAKAKEEQSKNIAEQRLAWLYATSSDENVRDAKQSLSLIDGVIERMDQPTIAVLETLAAARAANGQFSDAQTAQKKAIKLAGFDDQAASSNGPVNAAPIAPVKVRLALYESEKPFVQNVR